MKIQLFVIVLVLKAFLLSQNGVEAGPEIPCKTNAECNKDEKCHENVCFPKWILIG